MIYIKTFKIDVISIESSDWFDWRQISDGMMTNE